MLEHLISDDQIVPSGQHCRANVEIRKVGFRIALETNALEHISGGDFENVKLLRSEAFNESQAFPIHHRASPVRVIVSDSGQKILNEGLPVIVSDSGQKALNSGFSRLDPTPNVHRPVRA